MILALSHTVITTSDVPKMMAFFAKFFELTPYFENKEFGEFVLPSKQRIAFFKPTGATQKYFSANGERGALSLGVTTKKIDEVYQKALTMGVKVSGPPKEHPWGEKSFLLIDPDGNRWEITESPSDSGMLVNR